MAGDTGADRIEARRQYLLVATASNNRYGQTSRKGSPAASHGFSEPHAYFTLRGR
jgi:hypothetical protein